MVIEKKKREILSSPSVSSFSRSGLFDMFPLSGFSFCVGLLFLGCGEWGCDFYGVGVGFDSADFFGDEFFDVEEVFEFFFVTK
jgi:hypothetical protein